MVCQVGEHSLDNEVIIDAGRADAGTSETFFAGEEVFPQSLGVKNLAVSQGIGKADTASCYHRLISRLKKNGAD